MDPTVAQFPSKGVGEYQGLQDDERPTGKCMNCGAFVYDGSYTCSKNCSVELESYYA